MRAFPVLVMLMLDSAMPVMRSVQPPSATADLMVVNARVYTVDQARPRAQAVAIRGGRVTFRHGL